MSVLAMYDIRGIQDYIFKTPKMRDAIGASNLIDNIIENAFVESSNGYSIDKEWKNENGIINFSLTEANNKDATVLYIGGGNAYILYKDEATAREISQKMSIYVLKHTYSLQLAVAWTENTGSYSKDYRELNLRMADVKAKMSYSHPICALPIMKVEVKTGDPAVDSDGKSTESLSKKIKIEQNTKLSAYESGKEEDKTISLIHIDGNNMGLRIRKLTENVDNYDAAVNNMRNISYNIAHSFREVFESMKKKFTDVLEIVVAGDDITYVCKAKYALRTVQYFAENIKNYKLDGSNNEEFAFSICGGVAYFNSHFPFSVAYNVAEECCDSAKKKAKDIAEKENKAVGNYVDYQICKNVFAKNLSKMRQKEYKIFDGTTLLKRPYEILDELPKLFEEIKYFQNIENIPRSLAKEIRNSYSLGEQEMKILGSFMKSRNKKLPDNSTEFYENEIAKYYDALELVDDFE